MSIYILEKYRDLVEGKIHPDEKIDLLQKYISMSPTTRIIIYYYSLGFSIQEISILLQKDKKHILQELHYVSIWNDVFLNMVFTVQPEYRIIRDDLRGFMSKLLLQDI